MAFPKEYLDLVLFPSGLILMFGYHLFLLYRYLNLPHTTIFGFENHDRRAWVENVMQARQSSYFFLVLWPFHTLTTGLFGSTSLKGFSIRSPKSSRDTEKKENALTVLGSNTNAATFLASVSLTLSSLIGVWIASNSGIFQSGLVYGDTRPSTISIKYISLLICFILAFSCFVQSARSFIHANYLVSFENTTLPAKYVELTVIRGSDFWSLGLRALYFAINLLLWFFGPVPMFATSLSMVILLYYLDTNTTPLHRHRSPGKQLVVS
ncbi:unnamed protein product, partial [Thlaspi arvense]